MFLYSFRNQKCMWLTHKWLMWAAHTPPRFFTLMKAYFFQQKPSTIRRPPLAQPIFQSLEPNGLYCPQW
jgi:hypothetical protein